MLSRLFVLSILLFEACSITVDDCPPGVVKDAYLKTYGQKCYRFEINKEKGFQDAQDYCRKKGGNLAIIKSDGLNDFVKNQLTTIYGISHYPVWIGLSKESANGKFTWVDGSPMSYHHFFREPEFYVKGECVWILPYTGYWGVIPCQNILPSEVEQNRFICEYSAEQEPPIETTITLNDCPLSVKRDKYLKVFDDKCYRFSLDNSVNYQEAQGDCNQNGGSLALVKSKQINEFIFRELKNSYGYNAYVLWIGLQYNDQTKSFEWIDGTRPQYENFDASVTYESGYYGTLNPGNGKWHSSKSILRVFETVTYYICEYPTLAKTTTTQSTTPTTTTTTTTPQTTTTNCPPTSCDMNCGIDGYVQYVTIGACSTCKCSVTTPVTTVRTTTTTECPTVSCDDLDCGIDGYIEIVTIGTCDVCKCS